jgi:putative tricarboxylic transport membrane protein
MTDSTPGPAADDPRPPASRPPPAGTPPRLPAVILGTVAVVLGCVCIVDAARIDAPAGQSFVGPAAFPVGVGILLILVGGALTGTSAIGWLRARRAGRRQTREDSGRRVAAHAAVRVGGLLALLLAYAALFPRLSYVLNTAALFIAAALLFGSGHRLTTIGIGIALAAVVFVAFTRGIGVSLPAGPLGF